MALPPGQRAIDHFPRFGVPASASRLPAAPGDDFALQVQAGGVACAPIPLLELSQLPRRELVADFHCVTTWSYRALAWSGYGFRDFYQRLLQPRAAEHGSLPFVELKGLDGYGTCLALDDLLTEDALLADSLNGAPLTLEHGAPLRLVVPSLYGYKSIKHLSRILLVPRYRRPFAERQTRAHPRGRVALEERGRGLPGPVYRIIYRAMLPVTFWHFARAARKAAGRR
jgi:DMSO/TMAO reductase YedYZ molybdopterin-dependent catalytic subunit